MTSSSTAASSEQPTHPPKRTSWLRWLFRIVLGLFLTVLVVAGVAAGYVYTKFQASFKPSDYKPERPLLAYLNEPTPPRPVPAAEAAFRWDAIDDPPRTAMPWVRWWWPGGDVEAGELRRELVDLKAAGFGGAEVQPFTIGTNRVFKQDTTGRSRVYSFDTPRYFAVLRAMLGSADSLGLQIDLTHYSGWPGGSKAVTAADGLQSLVWGEEEFTGGKRVEIDIPRPTPQLNAYFGAIMGLYTGLGDFVDFAPASAKLMSVLVARPLGGGHSLFSLSDSRRLDPKSVQVVDAQVQGGRLVWDAPAGDWVLVASWLMPTGETPTLIASTPTGYVVDILRSEQVRAHYNYAFGARTGLPAYYGKPLRAIFNDSYEYKADRLGSADILTEFQKRRGYDLRPHLPAVYVDGADDWYANELLPPRAPSFTVGALDKRIRYDYQLTISDLAIERFADESRNWAEARGLLSRQQSYGMDLDILRAEGSNHIPETEQLYAGGTREFYRMASSAAMLYGRQLVSSESFVWGQQDYAISPTKLKVFADNLLVSGINHINYHGFPYDWRRPQREQLFGPAGWDPWSSPDSESMSLYFSGNYTPRVALWADLPALNTYLARAQNLLRQGHATTDVLIYYPFLGYKGKGYGPGGAKMPMFNGAFPLTDPALPAGAKPEQEGSDERIHWLRQVRPLLDSLERRGITWGWVNGDALRTQLQPDGHTRGGARYGALVFADVPAIAPDDLAAAQVLQKAGVPVFIHGAPPRQQPGFHDAAAGDARVQQLAREILIARPTPAAAGNLADTLARRAAGAMHFAASSPIVRYGRALAGGGSIDFFVNLTAQPQSVVLQASRVPSAWWFDAATGGGAAANLTSGGLSLTLAPYESRFLIRGVPLPARLAQPERTTFLTARTANAQTLPQWSLTVGGKPMKAGFGDWRENESLRYENRVGVYRSRFDAPALREGSRYVLQAGPVLGTASVKVNGKEAGRLSLPPWRADITSLLQPGRNAIEILYQPPLRNWMIGRALAGDERYAYFRNRKEALVPAGLRGPVQVVELTNKGQ